MLPNNSLSQTPDSTALPPVASAVPVPPSQAQMPLPPPSQPTALAVSNIVAQTKQVIGQYQGNPYQLSEALGSLKSQYLAEQFHINTNPGQK